MAQTSATSFRFLQSCLCTRALSLLQHLAVSSLSLILAAKCCNLTPTGRKWLAAPLLSTTAHRPAEISSDILIPISWQPWMDRQKKREKEKGIWLSRFLELRESSFPISILSIITDWLSLFESKSTKNDNRCHISLPPLSLFPRVFKTQKRYCYYHCQFHTCFKSIAPYCFSLSSLLSVQLSVD